MHFVLLGEHNPEVCPTSNKTTRDLLLKRAPELPDIAKRCGVNIVAGPFVNREHIAVLIASADRAEAIDQFLTESNLAQWNRVRILPSLPMEEGLNEVRESSSIF